MLYYLSLILFLLMYTFTNNRKEDMPIPPNIQDFLSKIEQIESSGGKDTDHPVITKDNLQQGTKAIGRYGLMPNTIKELVNRRRIRGTVSPEMKDVSQMDPESMKSYIEANPGLEDTFANDLANHVVQKQQGDPDKMAYSWQMGHNLQPDEITPEVLDSSDYVQKYRRLGPIIKPSN